MSCAAYSTLEDAWGSKKFRRRNKRVKNSPEFLGTHTPPLSRHVSEPIPRMDDPICDLYDCEYSDDSTPITQRRGGTDYREDFDPGTKDLVPEQPVHSALNSLSSTSQRKRQTIRQHQNENYDVFCMFSRVSFCCLFWNSSFK